MSNRSHNLLPTTSEGLPLIRVGSAAAVAAIAPQLLGFRPRESLVLTFFDAESRLRLASRADLPMTTATAVDAFGDLATRACESDWRTMHISAWTDEESAPVGLIQGLATHCLAAGLRVLGSGVVRADRWHSLDSGGGLDATGESLSTGAALAATSQLVLAGRSFVDDRATLVERVRGIESIGDAVANVLEDPSRDWAGLSRPGETAARRRLGIEEAVVAYLSGSTARPPAEPAATWIAAFADSRVREAVLWRMSPAAPSHQAGMDKDLVLDALAWLVRAAPRSWSAPVSAALAALAWQSGDGTLAAIAAEYACECDPTNRLGTLVRLAIEKGATPAVWIDLMRSMSLEELRTSQVGSRVVPKPAPASATGPADVIGRAAS